MCCGHNDCGHHARLSTLSSDLGAGTAADLAHVGSTDDGHGRHEGCVTPVSSLARAYAIQHCRILPHRAAEMGFHCDRYE